MDQRQSQPQTEDGVYIVSVFKGQQIYGAGVNMQGSLNEGKVALLGLINEAIAAFQAQKLEETKAELAKALERLAALEATGRQE